MIHLPFRASATGLLIGITSALAFVSPPQGPACASRTACTATRMLTEDCMAQGFPIISTWGQSTSVNGKCACDDGVPPACAEDPSNKCQGNENVTIQASQGYTISDNAQPPNCLGTQVLQNIRTTGCGTSLAVVFHAYSQANCGGAPQCTITFTVICGAEACATGGC